MPALDPERGIDPGHVLAICSQAISPPGRLIQAVARPGGVLVCLSSRPAARDVRGALDRVGYLVATAGTGRDLLVPGWSPGNLESRLAAMRAVIQQLADHQSVTARAVIRQFRDRPGGPLLSRADQGLLDQAGNRLRAWVAARSGIHAPHDPAIQPADAGNALRLRAAWALEQSIDDLIERHLRVAGHALHLFASFSTQMGGDHAQDAAIRQAGVAFHLGADATQGSSALVPGTEGLGPGEPLVSRPPARPQALPGQAVVREFPAAATGGTAGPPPVPLSRPGGPRFPAGRASRGPHRP